MLHARRFARASGTRQTGGMDKLQELTRKLNNLIRYARVVEVTGDRCRVAVGGLTSALLPWVTYRAGTDVSWWAPSVGEQVLWLAPGGTPESGIVLGGIYCEDTPPPSTDPALHTTHYRDGAVISYHAGTHTLTATIPGTAVLTATHDISVISSTGSIAATAEDGNIDATAKEINASASAAASVTAPTITLTGTVTINGDVSVLGTLTNNGTDVGSTHVHSGVLSGPATTGAPV